MLSSPLHFAFTVTLGLSWISTGTALRTIEDVFVVRKGPVAGTCDSHLELLEKMFEEIQKVNDNAYEQLADDNYNDNDETRKLAKSLFGISPSEDGEVPDADMDLQKLKQVRKWYDDLKLEILDEHTTDEPGVNSRTQLYCDSDFMTYMEPDEQAPGDPRKTVGQVVGQGDPQRALNSYIYHVPTQNEPGGGAWVLLPKSRWDMFPTGGYGKPSYCAQAETYAWTLEDEKGGLLKQPIVILCPSSFTKQNVNGGDIPDGLDLTAQDDGKVLDTMEPRWLTWYHELFHIVFPPTRGTERSPDAKYRPARKGADGKPVPSWPKKKAAFVTSDKQTYGAVECMYTALYDLADEPVKQLSSMQATKNPETYAWFAVGSYLSVFGAAHQDWSSGACRKEGSPAQTVTVTREPNIPRETTT